jgi:hypothetical protein
MAVVIATTVTRAAFTSDVYSQAVHWIAETICRFPCTAQSCRRTHLVATAVEHRVTEHVASQHFTTGLKLYRFSRLQRYLSQSVEFDWVHHVEHRPQHEKEHE